jgi:hypothetical protein
MLHLVRFSCHPLQSFVENVHECFFVRFYYRILRTQAGQLELQVLNLLFLFNHESLQAVDVVLLQP